MPSRTLFGFARQPKRKEKPPDYDPGLQDMIRLGQAIAKTERPPPRETLVQAFTSFVLDKQEKERLAVEDSQIGLLLTTFRYLQDTQGDGYGVGLSVGEMVGTMNLLKGTSVRRATEAVNIVALAESLFEEINRREGQAGEYRDQSLNALIEILASKKKPREARDMLEEHWTKAPSTMEPKQWTNVLLGFAKIDDQEQMMKTLEMMKGHNLHFDNQAHQYVVEFYASRSNAEMTRKWYDFGIANGLIPTRRTVLRVLGVCIHNNELEWGEPILKSFVDGTSTQSRDDSRVSWKLILQWAAAKGKSVDEIDRLLKTMVQKTEEQGLTIQPDINMINGLISLAAAKNDAYTAERYLTLARKWALEPDSKTLLLQLDYRVSSGDLDGAKAAYEELKSHDIESGTDLKLISRLVVAFCNQKPVKYNLIMELVDDLNSRQVRFTPDVVSALASIHLQRGELHDLVDLLNSHAYHFDAKSRASVANVLISHCLDRSSLTARVWDSYNILRQTFAETDNATRTAIMNQLFSRGRSDMATHVFGHMRYHDDPNTRPTIDTYVLCFEGIGRAADKESLTLVYNMLKLDTVIEPDTRLNNALMLAYTGCGNPSQALMFWSEIIHSREGPTYNSICIALRACETAISGERHARDIWNRIRRFDIGVTREIFAAYVGALAGRNLFDECVGLVDGVEKEWGLKPDVLILGTFHNALPIDTQSTMSEWATKSYPAVWEDVTKRSKRNKQGRGGRFRGGIVYNIGDGALRA
ncbi:MAG: hypothetical protein Q9220_004635 [cf. Caloplaca sp. 1 TL-2023]